MKRLTANLWCSYRDLWKTLDGWKQCIFYVIHYTLCFFFLWNIMYSPFLNEGLTYINTTDGIEAHFPRLLYISQTIREGIESLYNGNGWSIPLYDFRTGLVTQDLQIGFPQILAIFWNPDHIGEFYQFYVQLIYYLIGLLFSYFGYYFRQKPLHILTGSIAYTFCGYSLYAGVVHPHFAVPMFYLPLLIVGTEKVLRKEKSYLLLWSVFLSVTAQWGLYFSCIQAILVVIYTCVRFFDIYTEERGREAIRFVGRLCVWGGIGALLSMFVAVPSLLSILGIGRVGRDISSFTNMVAYSEEYYQAYLSSFAVVPGNVGNWTCLGFSVLSVPAVFLLFVKRHREHRCLRWLFAILTVMLCVPACGYVMSGFSAVSNRFCFAYAFCVASVVMFMIPEFASATRQQIVATGLLTLGYLAICCFGIREIYSQETVVTMLMLTLGILMICTLSDRGRIALLSASCLVLSCMSSCYSAYLLYNREQKNFASQYVKDPYEYMQASQYYVLSQNQQVVADKDFFRVAGGCLGRGDANTAFYYDLNGISMYPYFGWSSAYIDWVAECELARYGNKHVLLGLNAHPAMLTLANCKYFVLRGGYAHPFGFKEIDRVERDGNVDVILENQNWLPLGYTYDQYITREQYETFDALGKQETQTQAVVLDESPKSSGIKQADISATAVQYPYEIISADGVSWENGIVTVDKNGANLRLSYNADTKGIAYLRVVNLDLTKGNSDRKWMLTAYDETTAAKAFFQADGYEYTTGQYTQLLDMGYGEAGQSVIRIRFPEQGTYLLEDIQIWRQPMDQYAGNIEKLGRETLENIETDWHSLRGEVSVTQDKILCIALPWMDGWSAYLDGEEVPLYRANTAFMAIEVPSGTHTVELCYWLPGLTVGLLLSGFGVISLLVLIYTNRKRERNEHKC